MKQIFQRIFSVFLIAILLAGVLCACTRKGDTSSTGSSLPDPSSSPIANPQEDSSSSISSLLEISAVSSGLSETIPNPEDSLFPLAEALTNHMVNLVFTRNHIEEAQPLQDGDIFRFMLSLLAQSENSLSAFYPDCVSVQEDGSAIFSLVQVQQMVSDVFGQNDWFFADSSYDEQQNAYALTTGFGLGSVYSYEDPTFTWHEEDQTITASFTLIDTPNFPGEQSYGAYQITYQAVTEDGRTFLRYKGIQKIGD